MKQYIDFFRKNRSGWENACAPLLNAPREQALETLCREGIPRTENYRHTDAARLLAPDFGFYLQLNQEGIRPHEVFRCQVPRLDAHKHFVVNGHYYDEPSPNPPGVFSGSLNDFATQHPDLFAKYYNRLAASAAGLPAFNTLFVRDGYVLYLPKNTRLERPLQLTQISGGALDSLTNRRLLIILEEGAVAQLLVCDHAANEQPALAATQVCEIYVEEGASLDFCEMEESSLKTVRLSECFVHQAAGSQTIFHTITLCNGTTRNNYTIDLAGEQTETQLYGLAIAGRQQHIDNFTQITHQAPHGRSRELFKYILEDEAVGAFDGRIVVAPDAQKTEAYQSNRNLLSSNACRMYAKPQLEIYADDVKCSHGMTTGRPDESALFYMRTRGIPEAEALLLLKFAFANDVIRTLRAEGLRERLELLIDKRFRGELIKCQGCL
jgi:Fe-S cluster assembly protein SufD